MKNVFFIKENLRKFYLFFFGFSRRTFSRFVFFSPRGLPRFFFAFSFFLFLLLRNFKKRKGERGDVFSCLPPRSGRKRNRLVGRGSCNSVCGYGGKVLFCKENPRFFLPAFSTFPKEFRWTEFLITFPTVSTSFPQGKRAVFFHISTKEWGKKRKGKIRFL